MRKLGLPFVPGYIAPRVALRFNRRNSERHWLLLAPAAHQRLQKRAIVERSMAECKSSKRN